MCLGHLSTLRFKEIEPDGLQIEENRPQSIHHFFAL